jgi:hypothetical protein
MLLRSSPSGPSISTHFAQTSMPTSELKDFAAIPENDLHRHDPPQMHLQKRG